MTAELHEAVVQRVNDLGSNLWSGAAYRYTAPERDALSGEGARLRGGRWNPADIFPAIYLAQPLAASAGEFGRMAAAAGMRSAAMLRRGYLLHTIAVRDLPVLDLRTATALDAVGLEGSDIADDDWSACQAIGHAAWFLEFGGIVAPSATGTGLVITVFEGRTRSGQVSLQRSQPLTQEILDAAAAG